jgi:hypothetical protein
MTSNSFLRAFGVGREEQVYGDVENVLRNSICPYVQ